MSLLTQASLVLTPNAVKTSKLYSIIPSNGNGDMTIVRATTATRVNSSGLIESVAANVPRLNYDGSCPSILVEPQRTNLVLRSEEFENSFWANGISTSVTANTTISPNGTITADTSIFNATTAFLRQLQSGITNGAQHTLSFYAKTSSTSGASNVRLTVNNTTGWTGASSTKVALTSSWQRITLTWTSNRTSLYFIIGAIDSTGTLDTSCYGNVDIWGAQLEEGSYPTSFIPTTSAIVTRNADVITRNNIYTNNLITSAGGTWFVELNNNIPLIRSAFFIGMFIGDNSSGNTNAIAFLAGIGNNRLYIFKVIAGVYTQLYITLTNTVKIAIDWNGTTADVFVNGVKVVTGTAFTTTNMDFLNCNGNDVPKYIKSMMLFPKPLTDAECIALTTL